MEAVQSILSGLHGVARSSKHKNPYVVTIVDIQDRHLLLDMGFGGMPPVKANSWARVKKGRYRGDLALVANVNSTTLICSLLLVPRINMDKKRKRGSRPPQLSFNPDTIKETFGHRSLERNNHHWYFKGDLYEFGCLWKNVHMTGLSIEGINASSQEIQPFYHCGEYWDKASANISAIQPGDNIQVISGTLQGMIGEISEVLDMTVKFTVPGDIGGALEVLTRNVRKNFKIGDFVQVVHGPDRGLEGFLVHLDEISATIFHQSSRSDTLDGASGKEVS